MIVGSYIQINEIIRIPKYNKIDAINPGFGNLSENSKFAKLEACYSTEIWVVHRLRI